MMRYGWIALVSVLAGCATQAPHHAESLNSLRKSYDRWDAPTLDIQKADSLAAKYVYAILSDSALKALNIMFPPYNRQHAIKVGLTSSVGNNVPEDFTIQGRPFSRYQKKYSSCRWKGARQITVSFFDPQTFPNWKEIGGMDGGFSAYFTVTVDMDKGVVVDHSAYPR